MEELLFTTSEDETPTVDLNQVIKDSIAFTEDYARAAQDERGARVRFETSLANEKLQVRAHASELREAFTNLLRNAVDAVQGEGRITVRSRNGAEGRHIVEVSGAEDGMDSEVQGKLFQPPLTEGERGTEFGLAACYSVVRRYGGDIEVTSAPGAGQTFTVSLKASG